MKCFHPAFPLSFASSETASEAATSVLPLAVYWVTQTRWGWLLFLPHLLIQHHRVFFLLLSLFNCYLHLRGSFCADYCWLILCLRVQVKNKTEIEAFSLESNRGFLTLARCFRNSSFYCNGECLSDPPFAAFFSISEKFIGGLILWRTLRLVAGNFATNAHKLLNLGKQGQESRAFTTMLYCCDRMHCRVPLFD